MPYKSDKSPTTAAPGPALPGWTPELGSRLARVIAQLGGLRAAARVVGTSDETLANWRDGKRKPNIFGMEALADAAGVSLVWLVKGQDREDGAPAAAPLQHVDEDLLATMIDSIFRIHREENVGLLPADLGRISARLLNHLLAAYDDPQDRRIGLKALLQHLRADLRAVAAHPPAPPPAP